MGRGGRCATPWPSAGCPAPAAPAAADHGPVIKDVYQKHFLIGTAGDFPGNYSDAERALAKSHFNVLTPENCMKPAPVHPQEDTWRFERTDALVKFAEENGLDIVQFEDGGMQVEGLRSGSADAVLGARIRAGRLVKPVEQSGFGPLSETATPVRDDLAPRREQRRERQLARARDEISGARDDVRKADAAVAEAEQALTEREEHTAALQAELRRAQQAEQEASTRLAKAKRRAGTARDKLAGAEERMTELRGDA